MLRQWEDLPDFMRVNEVRPYWEILWKKRQQLILKRVFDITMASVLIFFLAIPMLAISIWIKIDSPGPIFYRQERVTIYGKHFNIHKFRTMILNADRIGTSVTVGNDNRITKVGTKLRKFRLDELPQIFDVIKGTMSFVGTRPEAVKYVDSYKNEYYATLLMPAGITSETSVRYKDEEKLLLNCEDIDQTYIEKIMPEKMKWNLESVKQFCLYKDVMTMIKTVFAVLGKDYR